LGIDPGTRRTGWGVVVADDGVIRHVDSGVIAPQPKAPLEERLVAIHRGLVEVIDRHRPAAVAVEDIFFARHPQGALKLGHARGVALLAAAQAGVALYSYPPARIKRAVAGTGRAEKQQIVRLVTMLLRLPSAPAEDQADALAIAVCHLAAAGGLRRSPR
jgi:crossover junction endodeoxyribonuclease RuvC